MSQRPQATEARRGQAPTNADAYEQICRERSLRTPAGVWRKIAGRTGSALGKRVYRPDRLSGPGSLAEGLALLESGFDPPPANLIPLLPVDDRSIACAACVTQEEWCGDAGQQIGPAPCTVVRWHLDLVAEDEQGAVLDSDAGLFLESAAEELAERPRVLTRVREIAERYRADYIDQERRPRGHVLRPVQLACQNVIVGLATLRQDARFDGLRVEDYATCEAPHLATHEGNRALLALILCDAFQNGGTMEIRFGRARAERWVPPGLERFARSLGLPAGREDPHALTPEEARRLFLAVTPMTDDLRERCAVIMDRGVIGPERLCYTLMAGVWRVEELDYILATSGRSASILAGGAPPEDRAERLAELEICRGALMLGTLARRLASQDKAAGGSEGVRIFEDKADRIHVSVLESYGAAVMLGSNDTPWVHDVIPGEGPLVILPRGLPVPHDLKTLDEVREVVPDARVALLVPNDLGTMLPTQTPVLRCPLSLAELDAQIERKLTALRIGRA